MSASPPATDEAPSKAIPPRNRRRLPNRSEMRPKTRVRPAEVSAKAVATHWRSSIEKPTSSPMLGKATLRIEKSTASVKLAVRSTARTSRCLVAFMRSTLETVRRFNQTSGEPGTHRVRNGLTASLESIP